ncbi:MAG: Stealth CR1 domain-containing protein [Bacteroidales bacterium]|nr:Stealth CR1 domain-containing protein [Bacteroidales bacterium]
MGKGVGPIDVVITWVDGDDLAHRRKRRSYASADELDNDDVGGEIRYRSVGEIRYCVASILRFASFVRKIFIVTDGQDPQLGDFISRNFPGRNYKIEIVDHKTIFEGYESCLPVFNSLAIETMLWRIPGLSDRFIYMNDDVMFAAEVKPEDFFVGDSLVCYASRMSWHFAAFLRRAKHIGRSHKIFGFKDSMLNAADLLGRHGTFLLLDHTPHTYLRDVMEGYFASHPAAILRNTSHRFRDSSQYNPQELGYLLAESQGRALIRSCKGNYLYAYPRNKKNYIDCKIREFDAHPDAKFLCINSISNAEPQDVDKVIAWLEKRLGVTTD